MKTSKIRIFALNVQIIYFKNTYRIKTRDVILIWMMVISMSCSRKIPVNSEPLKQEINSNIEGAGQTLELQFERGKAHNHPSFAWWIEDTAGNYIQTLWVTKSIGTGIFKHGDASTGRWKTAEVRRPAALPYWAHKRGIREEDSLYTPTAKNPIPDAYTGETPAYDYKILTHLDKSIKGRFTVFFEINQTWDWNEYWTNNKYPDDAAYKTSCQPALVYSVTMNADSSLKVYELKLMGHSHYSGRDGNLYTDLSTITTAKEIARKITATLK
jgi:hypothetical protein